MGASGVFVMVALIVLAASAVSAKKPKDNTCAFSQKRFGKKGEFDYYLLSLSYAPTFCASNPSASDSAECKNGFGFVLHGMWPSYAKAPVGGCWWPQFCDNSHFDLNALNQVSDWQSVAPEYGDTRKGQAYGMAVHEWTRHGSCSGLDQATFFKKSVELARKYVKKSPAELTAGDGKQGCAIPARGGNGIGEYHFYFDKNFKQLIPSSCGGHGAIAFEQHA